jgi:hypothetical protein
MRIFVAVRVETGRDVEFQALHQISRHARSVRWLPRREIAIRDHIPSEYLPYVCIVGVIASNEFLQNIHRRGGSNPLSVQMNSHEIGSSTSRKTLTWRVFQHQSKSMDIFPISLSFSSQPAQLSHSGLFAPHTITDNGHNGWVVISQTIELCHHLRERIVPVVVVDKWIVIASHVGKKEAG